MIVSGICKLCVEQKDLQSSHAIADSFFRKLFAKNSGKAIHWSSNNDSIGYSSDSWDTYQLCSECEKLLNERYERYSLGVLRGQGCLLAKSELGLTYTDLDQHKLIMNFLSLYWRAANSSHPAYSNVTITGELNEYLRNAILLNKKIPTGMFSIKLNRLYVSEENSSFTPEAIKGYIQSPFQRTLKSSKSFCFVFEGFLCEIFIKALSLKNRYKPGILSSKSKRLFVPYLNMFEVAEIRQACEDGLRKHNTKPKKDS